MHTQNPHTLAIELNNLIKSKSVRDNKKFTAYRLAQHTNLDRSLIQRILKGEIENPRIDTLVKIAKFFINDGFTLSLDRLIGLENNAIEINNQTISREEQKVELPLYQMNTFNGTQIGTTSTSVESPSSAVIAIVASEFVNPFFPPGTIFVTDLIKQPENNNLVFVKEKFDIKLYLKKFLEKNGESSLLSFGENETATEKSFNENLESIAGVVVKINAKV